MVSKVLKKCPPEGFGEATAKGGLDAGALNIWRSLRVIQEASRPRVSLLEVRILEVDIKRLAS